MSELVKDLSKMKQTLTDEGLYEESMSDKDMIQICKTLNKSKQTASEENEYHELMSQTELNVSDLESMHIEAAHLEVEKLNSVKNESGKTSTISSKHNIVCVPTTSGSYEPPIVPVNKNPNAVPILYHAPIFSKLSAGGKEKVVSAFLKYERDRWCSNATFYDQWNKPIIVKPTVEYIDTLRLPTQQEVEKSDQKKLFEKDEGSSENFIALRSNRLVNKRNYFEDDDDFEPVQIKKTKSTCITSKKDGANWESQEFNASPSDSHTSNSFKNNNNLSNPFLRQKTKVNDSSSATTLSQKSNESPKEIVKSYSQSNTSNRYSTPEVCSRTNKMFDKLKEEENKPKTLVSSQKVESDYDISDDDIFPSTNSEAVIHPKVPSKPKTGKGKAVDKTKTRTSLRKLKSANKNEEVEIPATNFYGTKKNELNMSNNNKSTSTTMTQCPICLKSFPSYDIELHASRCEHYDENNSLCDICNQHVPNAELPAHTDRCLKNITKDSVEKTYPKNKSNESFLCDVCDKFVVDQNRFEHASNCIAIAKK